MQFELFFTALAAGIVAAGFYGFLPISLILSYRISSNIAFVHGGIAAAAALTYWLLALKDPFLPNHLIEFGNNNEPIRYGTRPELNNTVALLLTVLMGAFIGAAYGAIVMSRKIAALSVLTLTVISAGAMLGLIGVFGMLSVEPNVVPPSPFGVGVHQLLPTALTNDIPLFVTKHNIFTFVAVLVLSLVLAAFLTRTHTGLQIRALADDQEAGVWCGIRLRAVGTLVYGASGAIAALGGVLLSVKSGPNPATMLVLLLVGLAIAVVGGMRSLPLAFLGALIFGVMETALILGFFGNMNNGFKSLLLYGSLLAAIVVFARRRKENFFLLESHAR